MAQSNRRCVLVVVIGVSLALLSGCSASRKNEIKDEWLGSVPWEKQVGLRKHREDRLQAVKEIAKATAAIQDARPQLANADAQARAAKLRKEAYQKLLDADQLTGSQMTILQAREQLEAGKALLAVAEAELRWSTENLNDWLARKQLWDFELQLADAQLNYARYQALKARGDSRVQPLTDEDFLPEISEVKDAVKEARSDWQEESAKALRARARWDQLAAEARARGHLGHRSVQR